MPKPMKPSNRKRNYLHDHPLLSKGGMHHKTQKAKRRQDKVALKKDLCHETKSSQFG